MIPKIIHQTWKTNQIPEEWETFVNTWKWFHPTWEYKLWTDQDGYDFIKTNYPHLFNRYKNYPFDIQRADVIRYIVVYHYGGLYADMDYECLIPFDSLIKKSNFIIGYEPQAHASQFNKSNLLSNALFASTPKNNFLHSVIHSLQEDKTIAESVTDVLKSTGPIKLQEIYDNEGFNFSINQPNILSPLSNGSTQLNLLLKQDSTSNQIKLNLIKKGAHAIHYWSNTWVKNLNGELINPDPTKINGFTFYRGKDSIDNDIFNGGRDIKKLALQCLENDDVVAFNTDGFAKNKILNKSLWSTMDEAKFNEGIYVKNASLEKEDSFLLDHNDSIKTTKTIFGNIKYYKNDIFIADSIQPDEIWGSDIVLGPLAQYIKESKIILDIGAHIGCQTLLYNFLNKNSQIYSFELQRNMYELLKSNINSNNLANVKAYNCAIGDSIRMVTVSDIVIDGPNKNEKYSYTDGKQYNFGGISLGYGSEEQIMITVDSLKLEGCDFIKIDVEGYEYFVIKGALETITKYKPTIYYENNYKKISPYMKSISTNDNNIYDMSVRSILESLGYTRFFAIGSNDIIAEYEPVDVKTNIE